jgi:ribonuclease VapC
MIVIDTSAIIAIALQEPQAEACKAAITQADDIIMSAGTLAEILIVAERRSIAENVARLLDRLGAEVIPITAASAKQSAESYARWGKGIHPAGLNMGDCFAYTLARERNWPLLFVGQDFSRADVTSVL